MNKTNFAIYFSIAIAIAGCGGDGSTATSTSALTNQQFASVPERAPVPQRAFQQLLATTSVVGEDSTEGKVFRIYQAAFDRAPDAEGLQNWINYMNAGNSLEQVSAGFTGSQEFKNLYGANVTHEQFVTRLYANVLHRLPDAEGFANWLAALNSGSWSREQVLIGFSESVENKNNTRPAFNAWFNNTQVARCTRDDIYAGDRKALSSMGEYVMLNNIWNPPADGSFSECITASVNPTGVTNAKFDWDIKTSTFNVHSYPEILFGHPQGMQSSTTALLPRQVGSLNNMTVTANAATSCNAGSNCFYDTGFDLWFQSADTSTYFQPSLELMVITETNWMIDGMPDQVLGNITVDGTIYKIYRKTMTQDANSWEYLAYVATTPVRNLNMNLKIFVDDAKSRGKVSDTHYLDTIEFGTEVIYGAGTTTIQNYRISM